MTEPVTARRERWEAWKTRHERSWNFVTTPFLLLAIAIIKMCRFFGWKIP